MSGHEFEKQVRQKLNDLKMTPSAGAWENIEEKLRERRRRPVAFYWVPLLLIGLAAGGYLFFNNDQKTVLSDKNSTHNVKTQPNTADNNTAASALPGASQGKRSATLESPNAAQEKINIPEEKYGGSSGKIAEKNKDLLKGVGKENASGGALIISSQENINATPENSSAPQEKLNATQEITNAPQEKNAHGRNLSLKISNYPIGTITASPLNFKQSPKKSPAKKSNKWSYGLSAFAGISAVNEGHLLNFNNAQVEDVAIIPSFAPPPSYKPSSISPGISYSGGLFVKRELSKKFSLSLGANYLQLNTRNKVGNREFGSQVVNSGTSGYMFVYSYFRVERDKPSEYHNRYHFIEVPLELHTRLNRSEKTPIQLTTGVAVSQLLKSSSLHFDGTSGVYYKDDRLLNQTQVAVRTGVSVGILNKTTRPLWIGPSAKYNISKILEKDVSARTNFMSLGVDVKMFIK